MKPGRGSQPCTEGPRLPPRGARLATSSGRFPTPLHLVHVRSGLVEASLVPYLADPREDIAFLFRYVGLEARVDLLDLPEPLPFFGIELLDLADQTFHLL